MLSQLTKLRSTCRYTSAHILWDEVRDHARQIHSQTSIMSSSEVFNLRFSAPCSSTREDDVRLNQSLWSYVTMFFNTGGINCWDSYISHYMY